MLRVFFFRDGPPNTMNRLLSTDLQVAVARVRRRLRAQRVLERAVTALAGAGILIALATLLDRLYWVAPSILDGAVGLGVVIVIGATLEAARRAPSDLEAARRLDRHLGTGDRFAAAVDFANRAEPTAWMLAAIADARRHLDPERSETAAPLRMPRHGRLAVIALVAWFGAAALLIPMDEVEAQGLARSATPGPFALEAVALDAVAQEELLAQEVQETAEIDESLDPQIQEATEDLNQLIRGLRTQNLRLETAHQRLASLEARLESFARETGEDALKELERAKRAAARRKKTGRDISPLLEAIREARWREAAEALEAIAKKGPKSRRRLGRDLERLAKRLESERSKREQKLRQERRRLKKKRADSGSLSRRDRRRLRKNQRALERLEREAARAGETGRQLERLERELQSAAQDLLRRSGASDLSPEALKRAADLLRRLQKSERSRAQMRRLAARSEAIRELLRRAAERGKKGQDGQKKNGRTRFMRLARGDGEPKGGGAGKRGGKKGKSVGMLTRSGVARVQVMSKGAGGATSGRDPSRSGDSSVGHGHDPDMLGERERTPVRATDVNVAGEEGEGPSSTQVVSAAAQRGFATRGWKRVHQDYRTVVEERMERQAIPAGHRRYVRRYFNLIRPR